MLNAEDELPGGGPYLAIPLYEALATVPQYTELWRRQYRRKVHINVAELDACLREELRAGNRFGFSGCNRGSHQAPQCFACTQ